MANYNPYGKAGAGAPMRDSQGNVVTNSSSFVKRKSDFGLQNYANMSQNPATNMPQQSFNMAPQLSGPAAGMPPGYGNQFMPSSMLSPMALTSNFQGLQMDSGMYNYGMPNSMGMNFLQGGNAPNGQFQIPNSGMNMAAMQLQPPQPLLGRTEATASPIGQSPRKFSFQRGYSQ
jgi:hypothetical protein